MRHPLLALPLVLAVSACGLPKDPGGTLTRVEGGVLRVGLEENAPWVRLAGAAPGGVEPALVRALARALDARVQWTAAPEARLMEGLKARELDLVVAGVDARSPWAKSLGVSLPYASDKTVVAFRPGMAPRKEARGLSVAARPGEPAAAKLRKQGALVVDAEDPLAVTADAVVLERQEALARGLQPGPQTLGRRKHVLVVPPGENAWLLRVDRFIHARKPGIPGLLAQKAPS